MRRGRAASLTILLVSPKHSILAREALRIVDSRYPDNRAVLISSVFAKEIAADEEILVFRRSHASLHSDLHPLQVNELARYTPQYVVEFRPTAIWLCRIPPVMLTQDRGPLFALPS